MWEGFPDEPGLALPWDSPDLGEKEKREGYCRKEQLYDQKAQR